MVVVRGIGGRRDQNAAEQKVAEQIEAPARERVAVGRLGHQADHRHAAFAAQDLGREARRRDGGARLPSSTHAKASSTASIARGATRLHRHFSALACWFFVTMTPLLSLMKPQSVCATQEHHISTACSSADCAQYKVVLSAMNIE